MVNIVMSVFVGGALGAMLREFTMLTVPNLADSFPLDILVANLLAACSVSSQRCIAGRSCPKVPRCWSAPALPADCQHFPPLSMAQSC
jgi:fluoride ion exporter CrcB/FEX